MKIPFISLTLSILITLSTYAEKFTLVVIPDTQYMTLDSGYNGQWMNHFEAQAEWIVANKESLNIQYVAHVGDIVEDGHNRTHWERANNPMSLIESANIPYGIAPGNHDADFWNSDNWGWTRWTSLNQWFPKSRYESNVAGFQDGFPSGTAENHYTFFHASGMEFMVLNLQFGIYQSVINWADTILKQHPNKRVILNCHDVHAAGIYDLANNNNNVFLVVSGHYCAREWSRANERSDGSIWMDILSDYQGDGSGGWSGCTGGNGGVAEALLRYYEFDPEQNLITAHTYSPITDNYKTIPSSFFSWDYDMSAEGEEKPLPDFIQFEDFDRAYDSTPGNSGNAYRQTDVDIENCSQGGYNVGWTADNEWLEYDLFIETTGSYSINIDVASLQGNGNVYAYANDILVAQFAMPKTDSWQNWITLEQNIRLPQGDVTMRFETEAGYNLDKFSLTYNEPIITTIEFEYYDRAYDTTTGNSGNAYNNEDVDIQTKAQGGYNIGWTDHNEWLEYDIQTMDAGTYSLSLNVASPYSNGQVSVLANATLIKTITIPQTGSWQTWELTTHDVTLPKGNITLRFNLAPNYNLDYYSLRAFGVNRL